MKKNVATIKKVFVGALAATMILGMSMSAFADGEPENKQITEITKTYTAENLLDGAVESPAETFTVTFTNYAVYNAGAEYSTVASIPAISTVTISAAKDDAGSANVLKSAITLPTYTSVGDFWYEVKETAGATAGVTYDTNTYYLHVQVSNGTSGLESTVTLHKTAPTAENPIGSATDSSDKVMGVTNKYSAGNLAVTKTVTGNAGDKDKRFAITVTFTKASDKTMASDITYTAVTSETGTAADQTLAAAAWTGDTATATIWMKDGDTVTFKNVPYDVTYTITEADYTSLGYDAATISYDDTNKKIDSAADTVTVTNNKTTAIDIGVMTKNAPFIAILACAVIACVVFFRRRRGNGDY